MNVKSLLIGALSGAVLFAVIDRLVQDHERRSAIAEKVSRATGGTVDSGQNELQSIAPPSTPVSPPESPDAFDEPAEIEGDDQSEAGGTRSRQEALPADPEDEERQDSAGESAPSATDHEGAAAVATPMDDSAWGPYMEQTLRQFLAGHPSAPKFDVLSVVCGPAQCEVRAAGFDESTWPVWQQVMYDLGQQPWYEFGEAGSDAGRFPEYDGRYVLRTKLKRRPRQ